MIDIALNDGGAIELDAIGADRTLDATSDRQFVGDNIALDLRAIAYLDGRGVDFSLHVTKNRQLPLANNLADNRKSGTDGGCRFW